MQEQPTNQRQQLSTATGWYIPDNWQNLDEPGNEPPVRPTERQLRQLSDALGCGVQLTPLDEMTADPYEPCEPTMGVDGDPRYCVWWLTLDKPQPFGRIVTIHDVTAIVEPPVHHNPDNGDTEGEW